MLGTICFIIGFLIGFIIITCVFRGGDVDKDALPQENYVAYKLRLERRLQQIRDGSPSRYWITIEEMEKILEEENGRME